MAKTAITVKITDKGVKDASVKLFGSGKASVTVGVFGSKGAEPHKGESTKPLTMVEIAAIHEFGAGKIPQRSFIRSYFDANMPKLQAQMLKIMEGLIAKAVKTGQPITEGDRRKALNLIGVYVVGEIQRRIAAGEIVPPLAQSTIDRKGSSKPLIDKGQLRSSISHKVELGK